MADRLLSQHFALAELLPGGMHENDVATGVIEALQRLALNVLEPAREILGTAIHVSSGFRTPELNRVVGGSVTSDHLTGNAADLYALASNGRTWEDNTYRLHDVIAERLPSAFGQVILEDHRIAEHAPGRFWVHVSNPTPHHPALAAHNRMLISFARGSYHEWKRA